MLVKTANKLIESIVPSDFKLDDELFRKNKLYVIYSFIGIAFLIVYGFFYSNIDFIFPSRVCFSLALLVFLTLFLYVLTKGWKYCTYIITTLVLIAMWLITESTGGITSPGLPWMITSPVFGFMLINRRAGITYSILMLLGLPLFYLIKEFNLTFVPYYDIKINTYLYGLMDSGFLIFILTVVFFVYEKSMNDIFTNLKFANMQIEDKMQENEQKNKELIIQRDRAEASTKAKAQFLSSMSHEIRTPMNTIIGMIHILIQEEPRQDQVENLKVLKFSAESLLSLINDILDFSKIEAGKVEIEQVDFNLKDLINGVVNSQNQRASEKNIVIKSFIDSDIPEMVVGDPTRLGQILTNIVGNAVKFTANGSVSVDVLLEKSVNSSLFIKFAVVDTGIGIPQDKLETIFESFSQANTQITRNYGGSGLGLTITKRLLEIKNSKIYVESEEGKGSKFYFTIELKKSNIVVYHETKSSFAKQTFDSLKGVKVLLVEDNEANTYIAVKFLTKWDIEVDTAANGKIAVEKIIANNYDLVLMDLMMPIMDGYQATNTIRAMSDEKYQKLPILALTASTLIDINRKTNIKGMDDFITKPYIPNDLYNKIRKWSGKF